MSHIYFINFVEGVNPPMSKAHCGCTSFHKYVIMIILRVLPKSNEGLYLPSIKAQGFKTGSF